MVQLISIKFIIPIQVPVYVGTYTIIIILIIKHICEIIVLYYDL